ncbi:phosphotransferase [Paracoccus cavernae]|uniref:Phosphotransferase n=1 Tax=Paracoccus cavernae TaxID=1571207 RepID=A0ABT8D6L8_9RHOB|nr:phosphotransferase [Paracoccus cavernae]
MSLLVPAPIGNGLLPDHPDLAGMVVTEVLRDRPGHAVFAVRWRERPYFVKVFRHADAAGLVRATVATLSRAAEDLGQAENAVVRLRLVLPEAGVIVLDPVAGEQLTNVLLPATPQRRATLIARAGCWLAALTHERERAAFGPQYWLEGLRKQLGAQATSDPVLVRHLSAMREAGREIKGIAVERAASHGDFTPDNLYLDGARLVGIDMQRSPQMAVARDVARFLVWLHSRRFEMPAVTRHGVSAADYAALVSVPGLIPADQEPILRFMMGEIMAGYYHQAQGKPQRRELLAGAMAHWAKA